MSNPLDQVETLYVSAQTILAYLQDYQKPRDYMARLVKKGDLLRLKNGFYIIASRLRRGFKDYPYEQIANLLYGPSYISLEWALSFYQLIPERVTVVTSVTIGSNKEFSTPIGFFSYQHLSVSRYSMGMSLQHIHGQLGGFLIATPEKALADWVFLTCKGLNEESLLQDLIEGKRMERESLKSLNKIMMENIANQYKSKTIKILSLLINKL